MREDYYRDFNNARFALEDTIESDLKGFERAYTEYNVACERDEFYESACIEQQLNYLYFVRDKINAEIKRIKRAEKSSHSVVLK